MAMANSASTRGNRVINSPVLTGKFDRSVSLLAWGYNEEQLIEGFLDRAFALMDEVVEDFEVIFVNDGSYDRTGEIVDAYASREPRLRVIHNERNLNVGISCRRAIAAASKDYLLWQCVDWSYDLKNIRIFLELTKYYDIIQGVRPTPIRIFSNIPVIRSVYAAYASDPLASSSSSGRRFFGPVPSI